jgi:hypothetical protein
METSFDGVGVERAAKKGKTTLQRMGYGSNAAC